MMTRFVTSIFAISVAARWLAPAGAGEPSEPQDFWNPTVVTPTGQVSRVSESPSTTFVILGDEIRRSGATSIPEILRRVPGLDVRTITATDGQLGLRGFAYEITDRVLVLVDGRTVYIDFFGGTSYEMLPVSLVDIERIEVVLGPGASVYGNKAMLGTINIITRSAQDYPYPEARVDAGPPGETRVGVRHGEIRGPWRLRATGVFRRLTPYEDEGRDPAPAGGGTLSATYSPRAGASASLEIGGMRGEAYVIPTATRVDRFDATLGYARAQGRLGLGGPGSPYGDLNLDLVWNGGEIRSPTFPGTGGGFEATFHTPYVRLHHELRLRPWNVAMQARWGGEVRLNTLESTITSGERDLWNVAGFASNEVALGRWRLTTGLRVDRSTLTRFHVSPRVSVVWSPVEQHQVRAAFNTGYNDAHLLHYFADLDLSPTLHLRGNPDLDAEGVLYGELGWTGRLTGALRAFATTFAYRFTDWISLDPNHATAQGIAYGNNEALDVFGGEVGLELRIRRAFTAYATYAFLGPKGARVYPYRIDPHGSPQHKVGAGFLAEHRSGAYATADAQYFGRSEVARLPPAPDPADPFERTPLAEFVMMNARVGYARRAAPGSHLDLSIAVSNALDDRTRQFPGAEAPERRVTAAVAWYH